VRITWRPFQLNANASPEGLTKIEAYTTKFGPERAAAILSPTSPMIARFSEVGSLATPSKRTAWRRTRRRWAALRCRTS
jgi:predicted DsbA family dithiol-disulfide isomerase